MAIAAAVHPSSSSPPPPPPLARRMVAWLVCTHLAWAAVDAVICLFLASMWLIFLGQATMGIGRLACGEGCAVVTAAYEVVSVAARVTLVLVIPFTGLLTALTMARTKAPAAATDIEATKEPAPETSYATTWDTLCAALGLAVMAFTVLMLIGALVMGSRWERMGSVIFEVGAYGTVLGNCFVSGPLMTVMVWRAWRKARHAL